MPPTRANEEAMALAACYALLRSLARRPEKGPEPVHRVETREPVEQDAPKLPLPVNEGNAGEVG